MDPNSKGKGKTVAPTSNDRPTNARRPSQIPVPAGSSLDSVRAKWEDISRMSDAEAAGNTGTTSTLVAPSLLSARPSRETLSRIPVPSRTPNPTGRSRSTSGPSFESRLRQFASETEKKDEEIDKLRRQIEDQMKELIDIEAAVKKHKQAAQVEKAALESKVQQMSVEYFDLRTDHAEQTKDLERQTERVTQLEPQAILATMLQTEVNALKNVEHPRLKDQINQLKTQLGKFDPTMSNEEKEELEDLREEVGDLRDECDSSFEHIKSLNMTARANQKLLAKQDATIIVLHAAHAKVVRDVINKEASLAKAATEYTAVTKENSQLKERVHILEGRLSLAQNKAEVYQKFHESHQVMDRSKALTAASTDLRAQGEASAAVRSGQFDMATGGATSAAYPRTQPSHPETQAPLEDTGVQVDAPAHPLAKPLQITIRVEPSAKEKLNILQRLKGITAPGTTFEIDGPVEIANALRTGMLQAEADSAADKNRIVDLKKKVWSQVGEIDKIKKSGCAVSAHKTLADEVEAKKAQIAMQDSMLANQGKELAKLAGRGAQNGVDGG